MCFAARSLTRTNLGMMRAPTVCNERTPNSRKTKDSATAAATAKTTTTANSSNGTDTLSARNAQLVELRNEKGDERISLTRFFFLSF